MNETHVKESRAPLRIGVVIVAHDSGALLLDCVKGVLRDASVSSVVVVDNSSDPQSMRVVSNLSLIDARLEYFDAKSNLGFAAACNRGVSLLGSWTHVFFVNPDVRLVEPLSVLVDHLDAGPQAIVAGRLSSPGHTRSLNARPIVSVGREVRRAFAGRRAYRQPYPSIESETGNSPFAVGQVDGALLGMSASTFSQLRGFDEQFELYFEDVDICERARPLGGCLFVPKDWGVHIGGASSSKVPELSYCLLAISRARYLRKHFGQTKPMSLLILSIALIELATRTLTRQGEGVRVRLKAVGLQMREIRTPGSVLLLKL